MTLQHRAELNAYYSLPQIQIQIRVISGVSRVNLSGR